MHPKLTPTKRSLVTGLVIAAASWPVAAEASPMPAGPPSNPVPPILTAPVHAAGAQSSFEWGDAGVGAAGAVAVLGVGALASTACRRRGVARPTVH